MKRPLRFASLGAAIGLASAVFGVSQPIATASDGTDAKAVYARLTAEAAQGDVSAREYLAALDDYLWENGLSADDLSPLREPATNRVTDGVLGLRVEDAGPWFISLTNDTEFPDAKTLAAYRALRHGSLAAIATSGPESVVEVVVSPSRFMTIGEFARDLTCPCETAMMIVDVYAADGAWLMTSGGNLKGRDIAIQAQQVESEFREQVGMSLDMFPGVLSDDLTFTVRLVRMTLPAGAALATSASESILIVDPVDDLRAGFIGQAAVIEVNYGTDPFEAHSRLTLHRAIGPGGDIPVIEPTGGDDNG